MRAGKVYIKKVKTKKHLQLAWLDPETGLEKRKSAGTNRARDAAREADVLERELRRGVPLAGFGWYEFCERYEAEHLPTLKPSSRRDWPTAKTAFMAFALPDSLREVTAELISRFAANLRTKRKSPDTVAKYLRTLRAALRWAERHRLLDEAPYITISRRTRANKTMKGRPITTEEFERMLSKVETGLQAVRKGKQRSRLTAADVESWRRTLWVFWLSGLRLAELPELYWDRTDKFCVQGLDRARPMLLVNQEYEKGNKDRLCPMTPDFVEFLRQTPLAERHGRVVAPKSYRGEEVSVSTLCKSIAAIGKAAGVVVTTRPLKYASAHDLRRSFGTRWAPLVQPAVLQRMMRHSSIATTMAYYVEINAFDLADIISSAHRTGAGDRLGDPGPVSAKSHR